MGSGPARTGKEAARETILDAAFERFSRYGYRRTSMDDIAREAGIARATVYLYFRNKEEIFRALAGRLHDLHVRAAEQAAAAGGSIEDRLERTLAAKFGGFVEIAYGSPHGAELLDESNRICGDLSLASRRRSVELLARLIEEAAGRGQLAPGRIGLTPATAAELVYDSMRGLELGAESLGRTAFQRRLRQTARLLIAGLGGKPSAAGEAVDTGARRR